METLLTLPAAAVIGGCASILVATTALCFAHFGGTMAVVLQDFAMMILTEMTARVAFRSPLDAAKLRGEPLLAWSVVAGTALAVIGIVLNHLALNSRSARSRSDRGERK